MVMEMLFGLKMDLVPMDMNALLILERNLEDP